MNPEARVAARLQIVDEHIRLENEHDLAGIIGTFGVTARFDDEPFDAHHIGHHQVRAFYTGLLQALPGLRLDVRQRHVAPDTVVLEVIVRGVHLVV
jgi:SnoaL-like domain